MSLQGSRKSLASKSPTTVELESFRHRLIEKVDEKFFQFCINASNNEGCVCDAAEVDDRREIRQLKAEYDRLQRELANSELETRRNEFFEVLPIKTCNSHQFLNVRNERLATTLNDIELLFVVDSDNDSVYSETSYNSSTTTTRTNLHFGRHRRFANMSTGTASDGASQDLYQRSCHSYNSLVFKIKNFFKCW